MLFTGSITALVTPFKDGEIDEPAFKKLIEFQLVNGTDGLVPCGTTGESATLSYEEHDRVIQRTIEYSADRIPIIAGTGSNSTAETIMLTKHAQDAGATAALLITPYYVKPTQQGLFEHYRKVSEEVEIPLILYNVPGRTGVNLLPETVARLSEEANIVGIKEATGDLKQVSDIIEMSRKGFLVLSGDDFTTLPIMAIGGRGVISVTSNVAPKAMAAMIDAFNNKDMKNAIGIHYKLQALHRAMFLETNPVPVKTALAMMGMIEEEFRLPLTKISDANRAKLAETLKSYGMIR